MKWMKWYFVHSFHFGGGILFHILLILNKCACSCRIRCLVALGSTGCSLSCKMCSLSLASCSTTLVKHSLRCFSTTYWTATRLPSSASSCLGRCMALSFASIPFLSPPSQASVPAHVTHPKPFQGCSPALPEATWSSSPVRWGTSCTAFSHYCQAPYRTFVGRLSFLWVNENVLAPKGSGFGVRSFVAQR